MTIKNLLFTSVGFAVLAGGALSVPAMADETTPAFIAEARPIFNTRLRFESVDQDTFAEDATAVTLRTRFGVESGEFWNTKILIEAEHTTALDDDYNSTTNGNGGFPVIADPEVTELNRAQLTFTGIDDTTVIVGRQRLLLGNQRFVGNVGWRQNEQTFDAFTVVNTSIENVKLTYVYVDRVHRIFGDDHPLGELDSDSHVAQADIGTPIGNLAAYGIFLDVNNAPAASSQTLGARLSGPLPAAGEIALRYVAELAQQSDYGSNTGSFELGYMHAELGASQGRFNARLGFEQLDGDGTYSFSTPLATLHKFQGWADAFLATPADGMRDIYLGAGASWDNPPIGTKFGGSIVLHDFASDNGNTDFGQELDFVANLTMTPQVSFQLKAAGFDGDSAGPSDRTKFWAAARFHF